jgi:hypothetical protein
VSDAEQALAFGLVLGAVPTVAIIGIGLGLRRFLRDRG